MPNDQKDNQPKHDSNKDAAVKPEPETLHTTDPQEHMEGPLSSLMHNTGDSFDTDQTKEENDEEKAKEINNENK